MSTVRATCTPSPPAAGTRWTVAGKWFRDEAGAKVIWKGLTYGPFKSNARGEPWPEDAQMRRDLAHIASLGCNVIRIYEAPTELLLRACAASGLRLLAGVPWTQHVDFFADASVCRDAIARVTELAGRLAHESVVAGLLIGNEIEKSLVRWIGPERVQTILENLITAAKTEAPGLPVAYANFPSTEYLAPRNADFTAFNVFLEKSDDFSRYLRHLQVIADGRPLVITEFGCDARHHGETAQAEMMRWQIESMRKADVAGSFGFSYTDEWHRGGEDVTGWNFGIVSRDRKPKPACAVLSQDIPADSKRPVPGISAIVCTRNGASTLGECLAALGRQTHPHFEVLVIDDGSTDATPAIASKYRFVKYHRQEHAGLSAARNLGIKFAREKILCFTDDDCAPDEDWLLHLAAAFDDEDCVAAGGPNLPPAPRTPAEAIVATAPGAPAHVLAGDFEAEHLPGCNLAIRRFAVESIGGFREEFTAAGDDVDVCWRLQAFGGKLLFVPSAVVWHHRRATVAAYLRQQRGYGSAEALLIKSWPDRFSWLGGARWRGAIYGQASTDDLSRKLIDHGPMGSALFPTVYAAQFRRWWDLFQGLPAMMLCLMLLAGGIFLKPLLILSVMGFVGMIGAAAVMARHRALDRGPSFLRERLVLGLLCWLQPLVRDAARIRGMFALRAWPRARIRGGDAAHRVRQPGRFGSRAWSFWNQEGEDDMVFRETLTKVCADSGICCAPVSGPGILWDFKIHASGMTAFVTTVTEFHEEKDRLVRVRCSRPGMYRLWDMLVPLPLVLGLLLVLAMLGEWLLPTSEVGRLFRMELGMFASLGALLIWVLWDIIATRRFYSLIRRAAGRCNWIEKGAWPATRESALAVLPPSTKLPEHAP